MKFILLYEGPGKPMGDMNEEEMKASMDAWQSWAGKMGSGLVDMGSPMENGKAMAGDGSSAKACEMQGYSIIEAPSMEEAMKMLDGHPFLANKSGDMKVQVFELHPVQM